MLRQRLEEQRRQIDEKLKAIDIVEAMAGELGVNGSVAPASAPTAPLLEPPPRFVPGPSFSGTIMEAVKRIALGDPVREWSVVTMTPEVQRYGRSDAVKPNVTTALRRLAKAGVLEIVTYSKKKGHVYRAKMPGTAKP